MTAAARCVLSTCEHDRCSSQTCKCPPCDRERCAARAAHARSLYATFKHDSGVGSMEGHSS